MESSKSVIKHKLKWYTKVTPGNIRSDSKPYFLGPLHHVQSFHFSLSIPNSIQFTPLTTQHLLALPGTTRVG